MSFYLMPYAESHIQVWDYEAKQNELPFSLEDVPTSFEDEDIDPRDFLNVGAQLPVNQQPESHQPAYNQPPAYNQQKPAYNPSSIDGSPKDDMFHSYQLPLINKPDDFDSEELRDIIKAKGLKHKDIANEAWISVGTLEKALGGRGIVALPTLNAIISAVHTLPSKKMPINVRIEYGHLISKARLEMGLDQERLGESCVLSRATISRIETGNPNVSLNSIKTVAKKLNITLPNISHFAS